MRLIDADALLEDVQREENALRNELIVSAHNTEICNNSRIRLSEVLSIEHIIKYAPTVEERPRGEWEVLDECSNAGVYCSKCHKKVYNVGYSYNRIKMPYCPNCGSYNGHSVRGEGE